MPSGSCADPFVALVAACRDLGLTTTTDTAVRAPHAGVDAFDLALFTTDADRLSRAAGDLTSCEDAAVSCDDWSGRSGRSARDVLDGVDRRADDLIAAVASGAAVTVAAARVLVDVLDRHRGVVETVSRPRVGGVDLDALPAALAAGAVDVHVVRADVQARLEYAAAAGRTASDAIADALGGVADAWRRSGESDGELVLAGLQ
ncbi:hypothetical protein [Gordonia shandongensis]|uniref:hypothetical protein n=1 Tax=Gordonia shandongensis TaxID=376351 RepID=UPI0003FA9A2C|nr:hypothetical protein [Gordonia shandongensis]